MVGHLGRSDAIWFKRRTQLGNRRLELLYPVLQNIITLSRRCNLLGQLG
jgi:hypothetical protein